MKWPERFAELCYESEYGDMGCHVGMIYSIVRGLRPRLCVELGVRSGVSTLAILHGIADGNGGALCSIDMKAPTESLLPKIKDDGLLLKWRLLEMRTSRAAESFYAWAQDDCQQTGIDFLLIDADHSYQCAKQDLQAFGQYVVPGGIIAMHDTHRFPNGAGKVARECAWPKLHFPWSNGMTIIKRPDDLAAPIWRHDA